LAVPNVVLALTVVLPVALPLTALVVLLCYLTVRLMPNLLQKTCCFFIVPFTTTKPYRT